MTKMVIADDEWLIRESLIQGIDWDEIGIEIVGSCTDGLEAFEMIIEQEPHILLTDIRMAGMTGLELIESAKERIPTLKTIIISGYSEFEYAQQALKMGADDYLLKPINDQELKNIVGKLALQIKRESEDSLETADKELLKVLLNEMEPSSPFLERVNFEGDLLVICWESDTSYTLEIDEPGFRVLPGGIILMEEANKKSDLIEYLNKLFITKKIFAGRSNLSRNMEDLPVLYKQALWSKEQNKYNLNYGCPPKDTTDSPIDMKEVFNYIKENFHQPITLQSLSSKFFISDSYFSRIFKQHTGKNFIEYLTEYRLNIAKDMLTYSNMKPSEVSKAVGYADQRYFSQIFKKQIGIPPSLFQKNIRE